MRNSKGITIITLIGYVILSIMVISVLVAITGNFKKNFSELDVQTIQEVEFDKINLQISKEIKDGKKVDQEETTNTKLVFIEDNMYTYIPQDKSIYLNDKIAIAEHITNCKFEIINGKILRVTAEIGEERRIFDYPMEEMEHNWKRTGDNLLCLNCGRKFVIGDYVDYKPDATSKEIRIEKRESGHSENQTFTQQSESYWQVLGIEDGNKNGTNETLLLKMSAGTTTTLYLTGAEAYNNGIDIMNKIAKELYSSSKYGTARSINITDINNTLQYTPNGGLYYDENGVLKKTNGFNTKASELLIWEEVKKKGTYTPDGENTESKLGSYNVDGYYCNQNNAKTEVTKNIIFINPSGYTSCYWIASRGIHFFDNFFIGFGVGNVRGNVARNNGTHFASNGQRRYGVSSVMPIISLKLEIPNKITPPTSVPEPVF